ncbi:oxysterol binding protein [Cryptosporidium ubiquitum]|uniref:Oxysterol binding protein n=1 Tax=Cryptosporidium ubiquitum TaxID=857276 RepID=A0A1J4MCY7_9CRYT|nr:oxysterol binding protein [Cryptosporidium ubiquitum]OII72086.1 oxysterol binding protein [Cryptosporidium ubiquitum]
MLVNEKAKIINDILENSSYDLEMMNNVPEFLSIQSSISEEFGKTNNSTSRRKNQPCSTINLSRIINSKTSIQENKNIVSQASKITNKEYLVEHEQPIIEGWLHKWTNVVNTWKPRYFRLYPGVLCYIKGSKIRKINIPNKSCYIDIYSSKCNRISLRYPNDSNNDLHLKTCSLESKLVWINSLIYSMNTKLIEKKLFFNQINSSNSSVSYKDSLNNANIPFLTNLLYELIKTRNLVLDELSEKKVKSSKNKISKYFDKLIDTVFEKTCNINLVKFHESDIYSSLFSLINAEENFGKINNKKNNDFLNFESTEEIFHDAFSDFENDVESNQILNTSHLIPARNDCSCCFWRKNPYKYRVALPFMQQKPRFNLWASIKESITKDISRITIPIQFNEPTSLLQRLAEDFRYSSILENASLYSSSIDRLREITIFSITPYVSSIGRIFKPFNPLLGETFELSHRGFRFIAEQVGHHPPTTAFYVEHHPMNVNNEVPKIGHNINPLYSAWGQVGNKSRFTGQSLELTVLGNVNIVLNEKGDYYTFNRPKLLIHNVIFGKLWIEIVGISAIINRKTSEFSLIEYQKGGWFSNDLFNIKGFVFDKYGNPIYKIGGKWDSKIWYESCKFDYKENFSIKSNLDLEKINKQKENYKFCGESAETCSYTIPTSSLYLLSIWDKIESIPSSRKIAWIAETKPFQSEKYFGFAEMTFELNEISPQYDINTPGVTMPCTDSRYRPDQRAYENGHIEWAVKEKRRLEEKQRASAKKRLNGEADYCPKWFFKEFDDSTGRFNWKFNHKYWIHRDQKIEFTDLPNIF